MAETYGKEGQLGGLFTQDSQRDRNDQRIFIHCLGILIYRLAPIRC
jgi:hypothetical protein